MTIAKRLYVLMTVPVLLIVLLALLMRHELARIEERSRFLAEKVSPSLVLLAHLGHDVTKLTVDVHDHLHADAPSATGELDASVIRGEIVNAIRRYASEFVQDEHERKLLLRYEQLVTQWMQEADSILELSATGRKDEAVERLREGFGPLTLGLVTHFDDWVAYTEGLSARTREAALAAITAARREVYLSAGGVMLAVAWLGTLLFRRIIPPIRRLRSAVETIAAGDYARPVPFTDATDETGQLARSIHILKGAAGAT